MTRPRPSRRSLLAGLVLLAWACGPAEIGGQVDASQRPDARDDGPVTSCSSDPCDIYDQCGCEPGDACELVLDGADPATTECRSVTTPGRGEDRCDRDDQCDRGYTCAGSPGHCRRYCQNDGDCADSTCAVRIVDGDGETLATACAMSCKPAALEGGGCPEDYGCHFYYDNEDGVADSGDEFWFTDCSRAASAGGGHGADCAAGGNNDCAEGFNCLVISYSDGTTARQCRQICEVSTAGQPGPATCLEGRTCNPLGIVINATEYGSCS